MLLESPVVPEKSLKALGDRLYILASGISQIYDLQSDDEFKQTFYKDKKSARAVPVLLLHIPTINFNSYKYGPSQENGYNGACLVAELVQDWW